MAIWQHNKRVLGIFSLRMRRNAYLNTSFRSKIWPRRSLRRPRFPIRQMHFHYQMTFTGYIRCFCATTLHHLVTLTFDLLTLSVFHVQCFSCPTHIPIFIILRLSVTKLRVPNIWSHFRYLKQSKRMRRVTWPITGGKHSPHLWNPWLQSAYSLCHFQGATTKIKPCYRQKKRFPIMKATKFTARAQYNVTCA